MSEWKKYRLKDLCSRLSSGKNIQATNVSDEGLYPVYGGNGLRGYANISNFEGDCALIGRQGAYCGNVRYFSGRGYITEHAVVACGNDFVCTRFLAYLLSIQDLGRLSAQSAQPGLSVKQLGEEVFPLPPLPTQRKIAAVLGALDDKIENNRKICANLEAQAQAIFKSWFVDFEPFGGKMPQGWKITSIYDFAEIIYGVPFKSNLFNEKAIGRPIIRIRDLKNNETKTFTTEHHDKEYLVQPGDLVVGMDGEFKPYIWGNYPALLNQRVCVFKPLDNVSTAFLYCTIKPQLALVEATEAATTVIHIGKEDFDSFKICLPSERWLSKFNDVVQNAFAAMTNYRLESRSLAALRDALLPKLMSGEIDVEKVEVA